MVVHFAAQQTTPQRFVTNNWVNPYSTSIPRNIYQDWMNKEKRVANSFCDYTYTPSIGSSSHSENIIFFQNQNSSAHITFQGQQKSMVVDVQQNLTQTLKHLQSQQQNMEVDFQYNPTKTFGKSQNDPSSVQCDAMTPNVNGFNNSMEENMMENDACKWDDIDAFLNEALNEEDF
uniref:Uncharacterized protein n=1 Tax=Solanum lycopersicum TaxID=4081 RepID=A0A3Q7I1W8_SOLLC